VKWALLALALLGCEQEPVADCDHEVIGNHAAWTRRGDFAGYSVIAGCADTAVVIIGGGVGHAMGVPPDAPLPERGMALSTLYGEILFAQKSALASWEAWSYSSACNDAGVYGLVLLYDWTDVDQAIAIIGPELGRRGYAERVGIDLRPQICAVAQ
jgi:hypothetical protein